MTIRRPIPRLWSAALSLGGIGVLLLGYTLLSVRQRAANPTNTTVPGWSQMADGLRRSVTPQGLGGDVWLWDDATATAGRLAGGMGLGMALGGGLGLLMGCYAWAESLLLPPIAFLAKIPPTAMLALFFLIVGVGAGFFLATIAVGVAPILAQTVYESVRLDVPMELIDKARTLGASEPEIVLDVIVPQVLPRVIEAARLQLGPALVYLIAAEYIAASTGFGYRLRMSSRLIDMSVIYPYLALLGAAGFLLDAAFRLARKWLCPWSVR